MRNALKRLQYYAMLPGSWTPAQWAFAAVGVAFFQALCLAAFAVTT